MNMPDPYSSEVLQLAAGIPHLERLKNPDGSAHKVSRLCGSEISVDLQLEAGKVSAVGLEVSACALGQAAASVLARHIAGADRSEIASALTALNAMLAGEGEGPDGRFSELRALQPAHTYPARHGSIRLAFEAALAAFDAASTASGKASA